MSSYSYSFSGTYDDYDNYQPHFLDSCFLCNRTLSHNSDIFMYRGNTPFCSQECRQEQIELDEASEKRWAKRSSSSSSSASSKVRSKNKESSKDSDTKQTVRTGTVAVA